MACLAFAAYAAGGHPSLAGLTVAYAAARAVGSIPLMPGGLLVVEAVLVPGLVSSGMTLPAAISAMLIYRLVSWIFIAAIGWVIFFFMFRTESEVDPDLIEPADAGAPDGALDDPEAAPDPADTALQGPLPPARTRSRRATTRDWIGACRYLRSSDVARPPLAVLTATVMLAACSSESNPEPTANPARRRWRPR